MSNPLPPNPGSLLHVQSADASQDLALAQGALAAAQTQMAGLTGEIGSDEYVAALRVAEGAKFYASTQLESATFRQALHTGEQHYVAQKNADLRAIDKDHDGKSDYQEIQDANRRVPLQMLGGLMAAGAMVGAMSHAGAAMPEGLPPAPAPAAAAVAAPAETQTPAAPGVLTAAAPLAAAVAESAPVVMAAAAAAPMLAVSAFTAVVGLGDEKPVVSFESSPTGMFNSRAWNQQQAFGVAPGINMDISPNTIPGPMPALAEPAPQVAAAPEPAATPAPVQAAMHRPKMNYELHHNSLANGPRPPTWVTAKSSGSSNDSGGM